MEGIKNIVLYRNHQFEIFLIHIIKQLRVSLKFKFASAKKFICKLIYFECKKKTVSHCVVFKHFEVKKNGRKVVRLILRIV